LGIFEKKLDTSGLSCPLPIIRARKALEKLKPGDVLNVIATDPGSVKDFAALAEQYGHVLLESREENGSFYYRLRKG